MRDDRGKWRRIRIRIIGFFFTLFFVVVIARSFYLQVIKEEEWSKLAERQHQKMVPLTPGRGSIYDRNGTPLAVSIDVDSCFAEAQRVKNPAQAAALLSPLLEVPREELEPKLASGRNFVWLQRRLRPDVAAKVRDLRIEGIGFVKETKRYYPNSEVASHVVGFTGVDPAGLEGVELRYNSTILGSTGYLVTERDALGRSVDLKGVVVKNSSPGYSVSLTLDKNIQYIAEKELAAAVNSSGAASGMAVVMEPQTGKLLALANYPTFNPNAYARYASPLLRNHAVCDSFEPGSTFKAFVIAAALEEKVISPVDGFNCENGSYSVGGITIHDTHRYGHLSVSDILKYSSNIGAAKIGRKLGPERLYTYLRNFGIGERSGIDLPGEAPGTLRDKSSWYGSELATISFGQGVTASAVQLAAAYSALANGGTMMKPYVVERIVDEGGNTVQEFLPQMRRRVVSEETARKVTRMMETVTLEGGTGTSAAVDGYSVAGKTGTAQKVDPATRRYSVSKRTASFIGFIPTERPRLTIVVVVDEPKTSSYGGVVAAPAFSAIARQSLCYLRVPPEKSPTRLAKAEKPAAVVEADEAAPQPIDYGDATAMPDFRGMSIRNVLRAMEKKGLNVKLIGSGKATAQHPPPGQRVTPSDQVWVRFTPTA